MSDKRLIAVDLDDVLSQTNAAAAQWHNEMYGTQMTIDDFHYYHWWKNPSWGNPTQTFTKVKMLYASLAFLQAAPVPGCCEALEALRKSGYRLAIVTTRSTEQREQTMEWIDKCLPDVFESVHFTGDLVTYTDDAGQERRERLSKGEVCRRISASLLIDDSVENVLACANTKSGQTPALLFGGYEWGKRNSVVVTSADRMGFDERREYEVAAGRGAEWWEEDVIDLPKGIWRAKDWSEVLEWIQGVGKDIIKAVDI